MDAFENWYLQWKFTMSNMMAKEMCRYIALIVITLWKSRGISIASQWAYAWAYEWAYACKG